MIHRPELLDALERAPTISVEQSVWRHMFGTKPPDTENTRGARWNPPGLAAIYLSFERTGAVAEGDHAVAVQPLRPRARRFLYEVDVAVQRVLDLGDPTVLRSTGVGLDDIADDDHTKCRELASAADWLEHDGLLVPSARSDAMNLVLYPTHAGPGFRFSSSAPIALAVQ